jgi:ABC-type dipeptide/oligopeptide/nickel transport system permease subunit
MSSGAQSIVASAPPPVRAARSSWRSEWLRRQPLTLQASVSVVRSPMGAAGLVVVLVFVALAILAPLVAPYSPYEQHPASQLQPPSAQFPLGTDELGRDLFSRVLYGARVSFVVGVLATAIGATIGVSTGLLSGYLGGWVDSVIMRCYDALLAFPGIIIGIGVISVLGPSSVNVAYALALGGMPFFARLIRSSVLSEREREYVLAARCIGARDGRIMFRHVLPNTLPPLLVQLSLAMGFAVLAEASLSFLGLGTQPPDPSWGSMLNDSRAYLREAPFYGLWPGLALTLLLVGLNFVSDALRDALDPRRANLR